MQHEVNHPEPSRKMGTFFLRAGDDPPRSSYANAFLIQTRAKKTRRETTRGLTREASGLPTCERSGPNTLPQVQVGSPLRGDTRAGWLLGWVLPSREHEWG